MSVSNGQQANAQNFNEAFTSRKDNNSIAGIISLTNSQEISGNGIANLQGQINEILQVLGLQAFPDANKLIYDAEESNIYATNGLAIKLAIKALDNALKSTTDRTATLESSLPKANFAATTPPSSTDDVTEGYSIGSYWYDATKNNLYILKDTTEDAAVWEFIGSENNVHTIANNTANDPTAITLDNTTHKAKVYEYYAERGTSVEFGKFIINYNATFKAVKLDQNGDCGIELDFSELGSIATLDITSTDTVAGTLNYKLISEYKV